MSCTYKKSSRMNIFKLYEAKCRFSVHSSTLACGFCRQSFVFFFIWSLLWNRCVALVMSDGHRWSHFLYALNWLEDSFEFTNIGTWVTHEAIASNSRTLNHKRREGKKRKKRNVIVIVVTCKCFDVHVCFLTVLCLFLSSFHLIRWSSFWLFVEIVVWRKLNSLFIWKLVAVTLFFTPKRFLFRSFASLCAYAFDKSLRDNGKFQNNSRRFQNSRWLISDSNKIQRNFWWFIHFRFWNFDDELNKNKSKSCRQRKKWFFFLLCHRKWYFVESIKILFEFH